MTEISMRLGNCSLLAGAVAVGMFRSLGQTDLARLRGVFIHERSFDTILQHVWDVCGATSTSFLLVNTKREAALAVARGDWNIVGFVDDVPRFSISRPNNVLTWQETELSPCTSVLLSDPLNAAQGTWEPVDGAGGRCGECYVAGLEPRPFMGPAGPLLGTETLVKEVIPMVIQLSDERRIPLVGPVILGRNPSTDPMLRARLIDVDDGSGLISRSHVMLESINGDVFVRDLGTKNGTSIYTQKGWQRIVSSRSVNVPVGTVIGIGRQITIQIQAARDQEAPSI